MKHSSQDEPKAKDHPPFFAGLTAKEIQSAARGCLIKFDRTRTILIHLGDVLLRPLVRLLDRLVDSDSPTAFKKILVVESGQLGDIVLLLPFLRNLRMRYPGAEIALAARSRLSPLLEGQALVDRLMPLDVPWGVERSRWLRYNPFLLAWAEFADFILRMRREKFDIAFCAKGDFRDNFLIWLTGAKRRVGYGFYGGAFFLTDPVVPDLDHPHYSSRWLHFIEHLGAEIISPQPRLGLGASEKEFATQYLAEKGIHGDEPLIGIHPGARIPIRQWGTENFLEVGTQLASKFPVRILWFQDPNLNCDGQIPGNFIPVSLPLRQFMAVLARCSLLICNDSGPMHIATALGVPVTAIFGPNLPQWVGPLGDQDVVILREGFWCRPCGDRCIFDQPFCLRTVSVDGVLMAATKLTLRIVGERCATAPTVSE